MIYFISDVHLGNADRAANREREDLLIAFLRKIAADCEKLFILGDLFDFWFEYKTVIPKHFIRTIANLYFLRERGAKIEYVMGNHDFGHVEFFERELDIPIYKDDVSIEICGKNFYLSHGDGKLKYDAAYNLLKKIMRHRLSLWAYLKLHPDCGIGLASSSSKESRKYTSKKDFGEIEGLEEFAESKIAEGHDFVVMGHRHKKAFKRFGKGTYVNLGEWISDNPHFGRFDGENFELKSVIDYLKL